MAEVADLASRRADRALAQHLTRLAGLRPLALAYLEAALQHERLEDGDPLDDHYAPEDLCPSAVDALERVVAAFAGALGELRLRDLCASEDDEADLGYDLWLAQAGQGFDLGRWGRALPALQRAAAAAPRLRLQEGGDALLVAMEVPS